MQTLCGLDCCDKCSLLEECGGCCQTNGHPLGGSCVAAEVLARAGQEEFLRLQRAKMDEINGLGLPGLHVDTLNLVIGRYINLAYRCRWRYSQVFKGSSGLLGKPNRDSWQRVVLWRCG